MKQTIKRKWLNALSSGTYTQATGALVTNGGTSHCCLGVLCDIYLKEVKGNHGTKKSRVSGIRDFRKNNGDDEMLNTTVLKWAGLHHQSQEKLAEINDNGDSYEPVIEHIKKHL